MEDSSLLGLHVIDLVSVTGSIDKTTITKPVEVVSLVGSLTISLEELHAAF